jgi:hypothetical protein
MTVKNVLAYCTEVSIAARVKCLRAQAQGLDICKLNEALILVCKGERKN